MRALLRAVFYPLPKPGDIYSFDDGWEENPFYHAPHMVEVLEVMNGWVRYKFEGSSVFMNEHLRRSSFHFCYKKMSKEVKK